MFKPVATALAVASLALAAAAPSTALARDRHDGYNGRYERNYDGYRRGHHDDHGDALAAGIVGLALGALIVSAATADQHNQPQCYDNYRRCAPPPAPPPPDQGYEPGAYQQGPYDDQPPPPPQGAYDQPAPGYAGEACVRQVQQYDPYSDRYVWVNLRTEC
jgi:hypothetical protein